MEEIPPIEYRISYKILIGKAFESGKKIKENLNQSIIF
jgi:hypothetical protein